MGVLSNFLHRIAGGLERLRRGYSECHGMFYITDPEGRVLGGVQVCYRVGEGEWISCGESIPGGVFHQTTSSSTAPQANFVQRAPVFHKIGESVCWRFQKDGFIPGMISWNTAEALVHEEAGSVVLQPTTRRSVAFDTEEGRVGAGENNPDPQIGRLHAIRNKLASENDYSQFAVALFAYGMAWSVLDFSADDAPIRRDELYAIAVNALLPFEALERIGQFQASPPSIGDAMEFVLGLDGSGRVHFRELMPHVLGMALATARL